MGDDRGGQKDDMPAVIALKQKEVLRDGTKILLRPPAPGDDELLRAMWERLSSESIRARFGGAVRLQQRWLDALLGTIDPEHHITRVAVTGRGPNQSIVAIGQLIVDAPHSTGELALLVEDHFQHKGVGTLLLRELVEVSQQAGLERLAADVLTYNSRMTRLLAHLELPLVARRRDGSLIHSEFSTHAEQEPPAT